MKRLALAVALSTLPLSALAQAKGPNGGIVTVSDGHDVEMVSNGTELVIYLFDDDKKPTSGRSGARAIVQEGGKTTTVQLTPAAPNRLVGTLSAPLGAGARVVVSATLSEGHKVQARFTK
ncbi:hypothetical protein [Methylobacterium sp. ID0610]|uniref:hypothetical protein n=1 Tax=Methylobacterium carpenticola TaxID=3344827 RepID=UPI0036B44F5C